MGGVNVSIVLHNNLFSHVLRWPATAFDVMPAGRLINRFGSDIDVVDNRMAQNIKASVSNIGKVGERITTIQCYIDHLYSIGMIVSSTQLMITGFVEFSVFIYESFAFLSDFRMIFFYNNTDVTVHEQYVNFYFIILYPNDWLEQLRTVYCVLYVI